MRFLLALYCVCAALPVLPDPPVVGASRVSLSSWTLESSGGEKPANVDVPGDLVSDLHRSGLVPEPHTDHNWLKWSHVWWEQDWTYRTSFSSPSSHRNQLLVVDGIKMGARVLLNGKEVLVATNQFLRYTVNVSSLLLASNELEVVFPRSVDNSTGIDTGGRFMACSGGWDWAPYGNYFDERGSRVQSRGIWKDIYLVSWDDLIVHSVVPVVYSSGAESSGQFTVNVTIHYTSTASTVFALHVGWSPRRIRFAAASTGGVEGRVSTLLNVTLRRDQLWQPRNARLFNFSVCNAALGGCFYRTRLGFRSVRLVTASAGQQGEGSGNLTMRLEVNGSPVLLRGANWIPSALFEGLVSGADLRASVQSAFDGGFNVLRVWGGGVYQYEDFYNACDELGIFIYHDMMITSSGMDNPAAPPSSTHDASLLDEISYQIRRLAPHPSIVMYDACNECGVTPIFMQIFSRLVLEDVSRIVWPASPSNGWQNGVATATGLPLFFGADLIPAPSPFIYGARNEMHGPYLHGTGAPYINDEDGKLVLFPSLTPPPLPPSSSPVGVNAPGIFVSEFGCVSMSSDFSMNATLSEASRDLHSADMLLRNYPCDSLLVVYFSAVSPVWSLNLYACMQAQALYLAGRISIYRSFNVWGIQIWQLNEIFPTGGWGSIETASDVIGSGQLRGGRWKATHYALKNVLYRDSFLSCSDDARCVMRRDGATPAREKDLYSLSFVNAATGDRSEPFANVTNSASPFSSVWFCAANVSQNSNCAPWESITPFPCNSSIIAVQRDGDENDTFFLPLAPPAFMGLPPVEISLVFGENDTSTLSASAFAAFVWLTADGCQPLTNTFFLFPHTPVTVQWERGCNWARVKSTVTVNHARQYLDSLK